MSCPTGHFGCVHETRLEKLVDTFAWLNLNGLGRGIGRARGVFAVSSNESENGFRGACGGLTPPGPGLGIRNVSPLTSTPLPSTS